MRKKMIQEPSPDTIQCHHQDQPTSTNNPFGVWHLGHANEESNFENGVLAGIPRFSSPIASLYMNPHFGQYHFVMKGIMIGLVLICSVGSNKACCRERISRQFLIADPLTSGKRETAFYPGERIENI